MKTFDEIYHECFENILSAMMKKYELPRINVWMKLKDYEDIHGLEAIIDLWGWYCWANENGCESTLWIAISHDINDRHDTCMRPRTKEYALEQWGEGYKGYATMPC